MLPGRGPAAERRSPSGKTNVNKELKNAKRIGIRFKLQRQEKIGMSIKVWVGIVALSCMPGIYAGDAPKGDWKVVAGGWRIENGVYSVRSGINNIVMKNEQAGNVFSAKIKATGGSSVPAGIIFGMPDEENGYVFFISAAQTVLQKMVKKERTDINARLNEPHDPGTAYELKVVFGAGTIKAFVNGMLKFDVDDDSFNGTGIGLWSYGPGVSFENIEIKTEEVPKEPTEDNVLNCRNVSEIFKNDGKQHVLNPRYNILASNIAEITVSSQKENGYTYGGNAAADGERSYPCRWTSSGPEKAPWILFAFSQPVTINAIQIFFFKMRLIVESYKPSKIVSYSQYDFFAVHDEKIMDWKSYHSTDFIIEYFNGHQWKKITEVRKNRNAFFACYFDAVTVEKVRFVFTKPAIARIFEIEMYNLSSKGLDYYEK